MPRIKRWFPVSHDINADPEVLDLTDRFGLSGLKVWLEILSIADRNDGRFGADWQAIKRALSIKCNTTQRQVSGILELIKSLLWVSSELPATVVKYADYHKTRGTNKVPPFLTSEPSEPILTNPPKPPKTNAAASPDGFAEFWSLYPKKKSKGQAEKAWRKLNLTAELFTAIIAGVRRGKSSRDWLKNSGQFIPHPATWLNAKGWEDREAISFSTPKPKLVVTEKKPSEEEIARSQEFLRDTINSLSGKMGIG